MMNVVKLVAVLAVFTLATACATATKSAENRVISLGNDGTFSVTDGSGKPVTNSDDTAVELGALLAGELAKGGALTDEQIWARDADGNRIHIQSGGICPNRWGKFELVRPTIFKRDGTDVGCSFETDLGAAFTFYYFKTSDDPKNHAAGSMETIKLRNPTGKPTELLIPMKFALHEVHGSIISSVSSNGLNYNDGVYVVSTDGWLVKLRVTYLTGKAAEFESMMQAMFLGAIDSITRDGYLPPRSSQPGDEEKLGS